MTRRIATLPGISMRPGTQSSKATIRQKDGDGAISTRSFWTYPTARRLSSVQFHGITDAMLNTGKLPLRAKPADSRQTKLPRRLLRLEQSLTAFTLVLGRVPEGEWQAQSFCTSRSSSPRHTRSSKWKERQQWIPPTIVHVTGVPGRVGGVGSAIVDILRRRDLPVRALVLRERPAYRRITSEWCRCR